MTMKMWPDGVCFVAPEPTHALFPVHKDWVREWGMQLVWVWGMFL